MPSTFLNFGTGNHHGHSIGDNQNEAKNMSPMISAGKHVTDEKRGKTCHQWKARKKHVTGSKREKSEVRQLTLNLWLMMMMMMMMMVTMMKSVYVSAYLADFC